MHIPKWESIARALVLALLVSAVQAQVPSFTGTWTSKPLGLSPAGLPDGRGWVDMIYDPVARMPVLFGGSGGLGYMNDIEAIDFTSGRWLEVEPYVPEPTPYGPPCGRDEYAFEFDALNSLYWIFGGSLGCRTTTGFVAAGSTPSSIVDASLPATAVDYYKDWQVSIAATPQDHHAIVTAYNPATKTLTLGSAFPGDPVGRSYALRVQNGGGTWYYNPATRQWGSFEGPFAYAGIRPESRLSPAFSYTTRDHAMVMFGGIDRNDTWALDVETKTWVLQRQSGWPDQPARRSQITNAMVYDSVSDVFVLFGGECTDPVCGNSGYLADTWIYRLATNTWTPMAPIVVPPARKQHTLSFDAQHGVVVLFGGTDGVTTFDDVWVYHVPSNTWRQVKPGAGAPARRIHAMTYDPSVGEHVVYGGVGNTGSLNDVWTLQLARGPDLVVTTTSVTSSANPAAADAPVTFTTTVTGSNPTGSVTFVVDGVVISGCEALNLTSSGNSKTAACTISGLAIGGHLVNATYGGDTVNLASDTASEPLAQIVAGPGISNGGFETPDLAGGYMASPPGAIWMFGNGAGITGNANAFTDGNGPAPQGVQVAFLQNNGAATQVGSFAAGQYTLSLQGAQRGNYQLGTQIVQIAIDGVAVGLFQPPSATYTSYVTQPFTIASTGFHSVTLAGVGSGSDYTAFVDAVVLSDSTTPAVSATLVSSANPAIFGSSVTFTAIVTGSSPTGGVTFTDSGNSIGGCAAVPLAGNGNSSTAVCSTSTLAVGTHSIVVSYSGDANNAGASSPPLTQVVNAAATTVTLTSSANPVNLGNSVTFTANVAGGSPTGSVAFSDDGGSISGCASVTLTGNGNIKTAACTTAILAVGTHNIVATYGGDAGNVGSSSTPLALIVDALPGTALTNGGFESPPLSSNGYQFQPTGASWVFGPGTGIQRNGSVWNAAAAPEGQQTAFLQGSGAQISQTVNLAAGSYRLSFAAARRAYQGAAQPLQLSVDGVNIGTPIAPASTAFAVYTSATFSVSAGNHTLRFTTTNPNGDNTSFIDAVTLDVASNQAPAITSASATTFTVGQPGTFTVQATGAPTPSLSLSGSLPAGVTFIDNGNGTATLSGSPAAGTAGSYPLTFTAHNGVGSDVK